MDGFEHHFGICASVSHEQDPGIASFSKDALDIIFTRYVYVIQFLFLDVVDAEAFFSISHIADSFTTRSV